MRLPPSVQQIADVIGSDKALWLVRQLPPCGKRARRRNLYIPRPARLTINHRLVALLGWSDAWALCEVLGGQTVQPALCRYMERAMASRRILALRDLGMSPREIASEMGISDRWAESVVDARDMHRSGVDVEIIAHSVKISPLTLGYILDIDVDPGSGPIKPRGQARQPSPQFDLGI
ncbi:hypothetical protein C7446_2326 [Kushneria sinocarnis]|uniref:Uncharacterized protein n=1 Tax=Kushneria sinocarnis TaxID=595502 RepID=A0A420WVL6_9GAMM|nr:hypothetical protein [Kushneria sinocarnis]RKR02608.1 hypothetical protein C7446_2326 [Kushneria sinocarnis]